MGFLHHLEVCNRFDTARFVPLVLDGRRVGFVRADRSDVLTERKALFRAGERSIEFTPDGPRGPELTEALSGVAAAVLARGFIASRRGERFAVADRWGGETLFELDRGVVPFFGTRSYGVHLNGLVGAALWIGVRSRDKQVAPGKLDNLVAGGIGAGYDAMATLVKEAGEEASIPTELAATAHPVGAAMYRMEVAEGVRDDVLFMYDLELPPEFTPVSADGEFESFRVVPLAEALRIVAETDDFKFNVNLVLIDLAVRRGRIGPDDPDYLGILSGLRGGLIREPGEGAHRSG